MVESFGALTDALREARAKAVSGAVERLRASGVAYVRFASVYRNFREAKDFEDLIGELTSEEPAAERNAARTDA